MPVKPVAERGCLGAGTDRPAGEVPAQGAEPHRGPAAAESGTEPTGDRGPTTPDTGTEPTGDRGPTTPRQPLHPQAQHPSRESEQSVDQLVRQVLPHVPALLERDGNPAITRVQLREILRREGLGGRNDRLSLVLQELRSIDTTTTRSNAR